MERVEAADAPNADGQTEAPEQAPELSPEETSKIDLALKKLHSHLGHPTLRELIRILKNSGSRAAIARAQHLQCPGCANNQRPASPLPARRETAELTRAAVRDHWISWAGPPVAIALDPSRPNV